MKTIDFFQKHHFTITSEHSIYDFLATKKGSNFFFLKYTDFYFVKEDNGGLLLENLVQFHQKAKEEANTYFKMPKALRLSVPNINSVFFTRNVSQEIIDYVSTPKKNIVGGEQESIFVIDVETDMLYSSGIDKTKITGEAKLIWGDKKEFKTLNGRNRAFYFIGELLHETL